MGFLTRLASGTRAPKAGIGEVINQSSSGPVKAGTASATWVTQGQPQYPDWDPQTAARYYRQSLFVMRCVRTIAETISGLPFRAGADLDKPQDFNPKAPLAKLLGPATPEAPGGPNPTTSSRVFWTWTIAQFIVTGKWAWELSRAPGSDSIISLWPLISALLNPIPSPDGSTRYFDNFEYNVLPAKKTLRAKDVFYAWRPSIIDWRQPESDLMAAREVVEMQIGIDRYMGSLLKNGLVATTMVITPPFEKSTEARAWQEQFLSEFTGVRNAGSTIFGEFEPEPEDKAGVSKSVQVEKIAQTPVEAGLVQLSTQSKIDITMALGVPMSLVGNASQRTYANADSEYRTYWTLRILPLLGEVQDYVNANLAPLLGSDVGWFDTSRVVALQPPQVFQPPLIKDVIESGVATQEQVAQILNLPPVGAKPGEDVETAPIGEESSTTGAGGKRGQWQLSADGLRWINEEDDMAVQDLPQLTVTLEECVQALEVEGFRHVPSEDRWASPAELESSGYRYDVSPLGTGKNWVSKVGGLPLFIRAVAHALIRKGMPKSRAIAIAVANMKKVAATGKWGGIKGHATPKTIAKGAENAASWEAKKAASHARDGMGAVTESSSAGDLLPVARRPVPPVPQQAEVIGPHRFQGSDLAHCKVCGLPVSAQVHKTGKSNRPAGKRHAGPDHEHVATGHVKGNPQRRKVAAKAKFAENTGLVQQRISASLRESLDKQAKITLDRLGGKRGKAMLRAAQQPPNGQRPTPDAAGIYDQAFWAAQMATATIPAFGLAAGLGVAAVGSQLGKDAMGTVEDDAEATDAAQAVAKSRAPKMAGNLSQDISDALQKQLTEGTQAGEDHPQLAERVQGVFDHAKDVAADTAGRREAVRSVNLASHTYAAKLPPTAIVAKQWVSHHDGKTRPAHMAADGQEVSVDSPFYVGGYPLRYPGQPAAPPEDFMDCRCSVDYVPPGQSKRVLSVADQAA